MSLLVLGLSHRTAPLALLERAVARRRRPARSWLASLTAREHVAEALVLSTCNRIEVYAEVDEVPRRLAELADAARPATGVGRGRAARPPLRPLRGPGRRAPVHGGLRAGLDGRRRGADPRPDARRAARAPGGRHSGPALNEPRSSRPCGSASGRTPRPASTAPAVSLVEAGLGPRRARARRRSPALDVLVVGAGGDERARRDHRRAPGRRASSPSPTAPSAKADRLAERTSGGTRRRARRAARGPRRGRPRRLLHRRDRHRRRPRRPLGAAQVRAGRPPAGRTSTWPCPATSTPRSPRLPGVTRRRPRGARRAELSGGQTPPQVEDGPPTSSPARSRRTSPRGARETVAPTVVALRARAAEVVDAELARLDQRAARPRRRRPRAEVAAHRAPGRRQAAAHPDRAGQGAGRAAGGADYAAALRELFDLDPARPSTRSSAPPPERGRHAREPRLPRPPLACASAPGAAPSPSPSRS